MLRQLLTESLLLAAMGGGLGLLLGYPLRNVLGRGMMPGFWTSPWAASGITVPFGWHVFLFTAGVTAVTALLFGLLPAWRSMRTDANTVMKESARGLTRQRSLWGGKATVAVQLALSTVLVVGAAVFTRTLLRLIAVDPGFDPKNLLVFQVSPAPQTYPAGKDIALHTRVEQELARVPGVEAISATDIPLLAGFMSNATVRLEGQPAKKRGEGDGHFVDLLRVGPEFLRTMRIPLLRGRDINDRDTRTAPWGAIINRTMADTYFPNTDPLGKRFSTGEDDKGNVEWAEVVGICGDVAYEALSEKRPLVVIYPYRQGRDTGAMSYVVRSREPVDRLVPTLRRVVQGVDPDLPLTDVRTQEQQVAAGMQQQRTFAGLTAGFGLLALLLACVGYMA